MEYITDKKYLSFKKLRYDKLSCRKYPVFYHIKVNAERIIVLSENYCYIFKGDFFSRDMYGSSLNIDGINRFINESATLKLDQLTYDENWNMGDIRRYNEYMSRFAKMNENVVIDIR
jgi:hypothetical protein